jgi:hypothetical protein
MAVGLAANTFHSAMAVQLPATVASGTAIQYDQSGGGFGVLTNGTIGTDNWTDAPGNYLGWQDPLYAPVDAGSDSGVSQPQLVFNLGGSYFVDSATFYYIVGYPDGAQRANVHAPDSMTATFSSSGTGGPFTSPIVETVGWNDAPAPVPNVGGAGQARVLTVPLGGTFADAVRFDFLTDGEWMLLSEVTFDGRAVPEPAGVALICLGACCALMRSCRSRRMSRGY